MASLPRVELGVLARLPALPPGDGLPEPGAGVDARRRERDRRRGARLDRAGCRDRLPEVELHVPALRGALLSRVRRAPVAPGLAAQPLRPPLPALRPAEVGGGGMSGDQAGFAPRRMA